MRQVEAKAYPEWFWRGAHHTEKWRANIRGQREQANTPTLILAMRRIAFVLLLLVSKWEDTYSPDLAEW
jgi:hypothetical protein